LWAGCAKRGRSSWARQTSRSCRSTTRATTRIMVARTTLGTPSGRRGGSSGGEAAIVSAGGSPLGLGGDYGGSIRIPAHFSGVRGLRPTAGRLTVLDTPGGIFPAGQEAIIPQPGPKARTVENLALAMQVLAAPGVSVDDQVLREFSSPPLRLHPEATLVVCRVAEQAHQVLVARLPEGQGVDPREGASAGGRDGGLRASPPGFGQRVARGHSGPRAPRVGRLDLCFFPARHSPPPFFADRLRLDGRVYPRRAAA
jgi:hypothetical protein